MLKRKYGKRKKYPVRYLTLMLSTDPTKQPKTLRVPKWVRFPIYFGVLTIVFILIINIKNMSEMANKMALNNLEMQRVLEESQAKDQRITELEAQNAEQYAKLEAIIQQAEGLQEEVASLSEYKELIDEKLNSVEKTTDEQVGEPLMIEATKVANANLLTQAFYIEEGDESFEDKLTVLEENLSDLSLQLSTEKTIYAQIDSKVEETLPFWEAYPSVLPVNSYVTSPFGWRSNPFGGSSYEFHKGVDLAANYGTSVKATGKGTVIFASYDSVYGRMILIDHGYGLMTRYAHNSQLLVSVGDEVERGQIIAKSGSTGRSTGPHLHYEVIENGEPQNPLDYVYKGEEENERSE